MKPLMTIPGPGRRRRGHPIRNVLLALVALVVVYVGVFAFKGLGREYPLVRSSDAPSALRGAVHVHTTLSDGEGSIEEVAAAARTAGLHFVVFTDHNPEELPPPRFHDGVLLIFAAELSTPNGHVVSLGTSRILTPEERDGDLLRTIDELGGFSFLAHPVQQKNPWKDWTSAAKADGLELYSADTFLREAQRRPLQVLLPAAAAWLTNRTHGLLMIVDGQQETTDRLLAIAAEKPYAALCSHDAHGTPSYESVFGAMATYVPAGPEGLGLPSDPQAAADRVLAALVEGTAWCAFHAIAAGDGFELSGLGPDRSAFEGEVLTVKLPKARPEQIELRVHGPATLLEGGERVLLDGQGAVQVEVWAKVPGMALQDGWKPWLVPSPVRVVAKPAPAPEGGEGAEGAAGAVGPIQPVAQDP